MADNGLLSAMVRRIDPLGLVRRRWSIRRVIAILLLAAGFIAGIATYVSLSTITPGAGSTDRLNNLFFIDLTILVALAGLVGHYIFRLYHSRRQGVAGATLHVQLAGLLGVLALVPTLLVTIFSLLFFHYGLQTWFSDEVKTAIEESRAVAESYLREHQQVIRADIVAMATDLDRDAGFLVSDRRDLVRFVNTQANFRNFSEAVVFTEGGDVLAESDLTFSLSLQDIPKYAMERARNGEVSVLTGDIDGDDENNDRVRALIKLNAYPNAYLFVGRLVDPTVLGRVASTREAAAKYDQLEQFTSQIKRSLTGLFAVVALVLLMVALWFGLAISERLISPIEALIGAAERVREGDLTARLPETGYGEEFISLARSFNRMTTQLSTQREKLISANREMDNRRRVTEAILSGVSSGVLSLDHDGVIRTANGAAQAILGRPQASLEGKAIHTVLPGFDAVSARAHPLELTLHLQDNRQRAILLKATEVLEGDEAMSLIVTLDDITALKNAQRASAWGDVARRIAHEIRNPLTPIQLSAERLNRRYAEAIPEEGREVFRDCIQTIIRHVQDIGQMVSEFSQFARMPQPKMKSLEISRLLHEIVTFQRQAYPHIAMTLDMPKSLPVRVEGDDTQLRQAITNILKNAQEAFGDKSSESAAINVVLQVTDERVAITVSDSGPGFPQHVALDQLTEPYVTHKAKGTGLGLAIVKKIMEDHGGELILGNADTILRKKGKILTGACVTLILPSTQENS